MNDGGFIDMINSAFGGAVTTLIGAFTGRLMWHSGEVKLGNRRFFGKELLHKVEFLSQGPFDQARTVFKEALEVWCLDDLLRFGLGKLLHFHVFEVLLLLTLGAQLVVLLEAFLVVAAYVGGSALHIQLARSPLEPVLKIILEIVELVVFRDALQPIGLRIWDVAHDFLVVLLGCSAGWDLQLNDER